MQNFALKLIWEWMGSHKISLAVIVAAWIMLSPSYNNFIQLTQIVNAHEKRFEKLDLIDEKLTTIMIELGIQKSKINTIENRYYYKPTNKGE